jgi:hypothetical protein
MNDIFDVIATLGELARVDGCEALDVVDLGDAVAETKQRFPVPWYPDSALGWGWPN